MPKHKILIVLYELILRLDSFRCVVSIGTELGRNYESHLLEGLLHSLFQSLSDIKDT